MTASTTRAALRFSRQEWALIGITAIWGATFLIVHIAMSYSGPWFFVGLRFLAAGLITLVLFWRVLRGITAVEWGAGLAIGAALWLGYGLQTVGLQTINSSTSAFITAMYVPLVPLLQWALMRKRPGLLSVLGIVLAFVGLVLLAGPDAAGFSLGHGETVTLVSTIAIAFEVVLISMYAPKVDLRRVTVVQLLACGILSLLTMPVVGEGLPEFSWVWVACAVGLGAASALIQLTMNWAQRSVSPTRATVIYAGEPVWAGVVGRLAGERLPVLALVGGALIVVGVIVSELKLPRKERAVSATVEHNH